MIDKLSKALIRANATDQSWQRGNTYYRDGYVREITQRGNTIAAKVSGNDVQPYRITVNFDDSQMMVNCTCPYDWGGYCKHIIATLLVCLHQPELIQQRPSLEEILDCLNEIQTQTLIQRLVANKPELLDEIEQLANRIAPAISRSTVTSKSQSQVTVDLNRIRSQVRQIIDRTAREIEYGAEEDFATEEILDLIGDVQLYTQQADYGNAIAMLVAITEASIENWDLVDEYGIDNGEVASQLSTVWCETILSADLSEAEQVDLQVNFEFWHSQWGSYFDLAIAALEQGWSNPDLKQVLAGNVNSNMQSSVPVDEKPDYAQDLALIRLQILARQERFEEYLNLALAEGQVIEYLTMLLELDCLSAAMEAAKSQISTMSESLAFSQALVSIQNAQIEALAIAKSGLNLPGHCQYELATWTNEIALELDDNATATVAKIKAFQARPSFQLYQQLEAAADDWTAIKLELLATLDITSNWSTDKAKIDIYLYENQVDKAISMIDTAAYFPDRLVQRVMDAATATNSGWVIKQGCDRAEAIIEPGKAKYYREAVAWLKLVKRAYLALDQQPAWSAYRTHLLTVHGRKYKLVSLMESVW